MFIFLLSQVLQVLFLDFITLLLLSDLGINIVGVQSKNITMVTQPYAYNRLTTNYTIKQSDVTKTQIHFHDGQML